MHIRSTNLAHETIVFAFQTIILSFNEIRREGGLAVAKAMKNVTTLEMLNLDGMFFLF